jgi:hypothetical protein
MRTNFRAIEAGLVEQLNDVRATLQQQLETTNRDLVTLRDRIERAQAALRS